MERSSKLIDKEPLNFNLYYTEKTLEYLCENCGVILGSKQALKCHMVTKHSEKVMTYQCSKCPTTCNRLDNMRRHIKKHPGQTDTPKTIMYEIKHVPRAPEAKETEKKYPITTKPYLNSPTNINDYLYQQSLRPDQTPIPWQLIPIEIPEKTRKDVPANPKDPRLSLQDLEEKNRQLLAKLESVQFQF